MVRLRLRRVGRKKQPSYRVVAADREAPRDGRFLEVVGFYNPRTEPSTITLKEDRIFEWLKNGAQPSDAVESLFRQMGTRDRYERFKAGEEIETLLEEYNAVEESRGVTSQTRTEGGKKLSKKAKAAAEEEAKAKAEAAAKREEAKAEEAKAEEAVEEVVEEAEEEAAEEASVEETAAEAEAEAEAEAAAPEAEEEEEAAEDETAEEPAAEAEAEEETEAEEDKEE